MRAVVAGPDEHGLGDALAAAGVAVTRVEGVPTGESLAKAGVDDADLYLLTDAEEATSISVAKDRNPGVRAVAYVGDSLPEFARPQTDLVVDPALLDVGAVAEELVGFDAE